MSAKSPVRAHNRHTENFEEVIMNGTDDMPRRNAAEYMKVAERLEVPLAALADAMDEVERVGAQIAYSTYMNQVVADREKWHTLEAMTQPLDRFAESLADPEAVRKMMQLLAPSLVFPAATPMQIDFSGEALHRAREEAELHKENLRKLISVELKRIEGLGSAA
jgi:hypothetical protein